LVCLAVREHSAFLKMVEQTKKFTLNILSKNNSELMKLFWKPPTDGSSPFDEIQHTMTDFGPVLLSSISAIECEVVQKSDPGDHVLLFGQVVKTHLFNPDESPSVHIRKFGDGY